MTRAAKGGPSQETGRGLDVLKLQRVDPSQETGRSLDVLELKRVDHLKKLGGV